MSYLYILEIIALLFALFANISSHSVSRLFVFGVFCLWKLLTFIKGHLFVFVFILITPGGGSKTILLKQKNTAATYVNPDSIKPSEENLGRTLFDISCSSIFLF